MSPRRTIREKYEELFLSPDPKKDADAFWKALTAEYQDEGGNWDADWPEFVFPDQTGEPFALATFTSPADFTGATFLGRAVFGGIFQGPASFARVRFCRGAHFYLGTTFERYADFSQALFCEDALFSGTRFQGATTFDRAIFCGDAVFYRAGFGTGTRERLRGSVLMAAPPSRFSLSMSGARFRGRATFGGATFADGVSFDRAVFRKSATLEDAEVMHISFDGVRVEEELRLGLAVGDGGSVLLSELRGPRASERSDSKRSAPVRFGRMSLASTELRSLSADLTSSLRFSRSRDIEKVTLTDVDWPERGGGYRVGDEDDMDAPRRAESQAARDRREPPSVQELERIYRNLRSNLEERHDRVGAHRWYFAEMDVGRRRGRWSFTKVARWFYWLTSGYGLAPLRPLVTLLAVAVLAFGVYMVPSSAVCPVVGATGECVGWPDAVKVVVLGVSFQGLPSGVLLPGVLANLAWVVARFAGVTMLVSIGVAFRNQIAR